jgi:tetratricopeptide (TPR) repeat protein
VKRGRFDLAEPLFKQALEAQRRTLGADHPLTIISLNNIGVLLRDRGRYDEAQPLFQEALAGARKKLGMDHGHTESVIGNLSQLYTMQGKPQLAEPLLRELDAFVRGTPKSGTLVHANILGSLSEILLDQKKYVEAESIARECLAIRAEKKPDGWSAFFSRYLVGSALLGQKKYADAEPLLVQGYEGMKQRDGQVIRDAKDPPAQALERLVQLHDALGNQAKAAEWRAKLEAEKAARKK